MNNTPERILDIFVYGDSLGLPRARDGIHFEQTYAERFRSWVDSQGGFKRVYLHNRSQGAIRFRALYDLFQMDQSYFGVPREKVLIVHCGIVDCAPRPIPEFVRRIIGRLPKKIHIHVVRFLHHNRARLLRVGMSWRATPPKTFEWLYRLLLERAVVDFTRIYVFPILPTTHAVEAHSPGLSQSIGLYNALIKKAVSLLQSDKVVHFDSEVVLRNISQEVVNQADGHHLTQYGHQVFAELLIAKEKSYHEGR